MGQPLPGLVSDYTQLPDGTNYWNQVIPSPYGDLRYSTFQLRDGRLRWVTDTEESADPTMIIVETGTVRGDGHHVESGCQGGQRARSWPRSLAPISQAMRSS